MSTLGKSDLLWWVQKIENDFIPIQRGNCQFALQTEASMLDWRMVFQSKQIGGFFTFQESTLYINVLELKAIILFNIQSFVIMQDKIY